MFLFRCWCPDWTGADGVEPSLLPLRDFEKYSSSLEAVSSHPHKATDLSPIFFVWFWTIGASLTAITEIPRLFYFFL